MKKEKFTNEDFYKMRIAKHVTGSKAVGWDGDLSKSNKRFDDVFRLLEFNPKRKLKILDIGCGNGGFLEYLLRLMNVDVYFEYTGIDVVQDYIAQCKEHFRELHFPEFNKFNAGDLDVEIDYADDYAVCVGTYTLNFDLGKLEYRNMFNLQVENIFKNINKGVVINGFHNQVDFEDPKLYYHDQKDLLALAGSLPGVKKIELKLGISCSPYEFTLLIEK